MTTPPLPLDDDTAGAVVDAMMPLVGIPMAPEWRETVIASVKATAAAARLVLDFPLDDAVEPAPVFRASAGSASAGSASGDLASGDSA